jgi:tripartite-type tricarboxylate transporter receptor subunit TctC
MPTLSRRASLQRVALAALATTAWPAAQAQSTWPSREVHLVVPWPAGGEVDGYARALAQDLSLRLQQPVVVENRAGATGAIGIQHVVRSKADGYTLLFGNTTAVVGNVVSSPTPVGFDPVSDLVPVALTVDANYVLWAHPALGVRSVEALVARARDKQHKPLAFGTTGSGALSELSVEQLARHYQLELLKVPYKGSAPQLSDLVAGHTQIGTADPAVALGHYKEGRLVPLLVIGNERLAELPQVPTLKELGIAGPDLTIWSGVFAPAGTPAPVLERLTQAVGASVQSAVHQGVANGPGRRAIFQPRAQAAARVQRDLDERRRLQAVLDRLG